MKMRVFDQGDGKHQWTFILDDKMLHELFMDVAAFQLFKSAGDGDEVSKLIRSTTEVQRRMANASIEQLEKIRTPFLRAVAMEHKRLGHWDPPDWEKEPSRERKDEKGEANESK